MKPNEVDMDAAMSLWTYIRWKITDEVEAHAPLARRRLLGAFRDLEPDGADTARPATTRGPRAAIEEERDTGSDRRFVLFAVRQGVTNLLAAGLFHMFEQHWADYEERVKGLGFQPVLKTKQPDWNTITELECVAHSAKHGEGASMEKLRKRRPDMFKDPRHGGYGYVAGPYRVRAPLSGDGLYVSETDLIRYEEALVGFWRGIEAHHKPGQP